MHKIHKYNRRFKLWKQLSRELLAKVHPSNNPEILSDIVLLHKALSNENLKDYYTLESILLYTTGRNLFQILKISRISS